MFFFRFSFACKCFRVILMNRSLAEARILRDSQEGLGSPGGRRAVGGWAVGAIARPRPEGQSQADRKHCEDLYGGKRVRAGDLRSSGYAVPPAVSPARPASSKQAQPSPHAVLALAEVLRLRALEQSTVMLVVPLHPSNMLVRLLPLSGLEDSSVFSRRQAFARRAAHL